MNGRLDVPAVLRRRDEIIGDPDDSAQLPFLAGHGITLFRDRGRLAGERRVTVGDEELEARRAVILAGGSLPRRPAVSDPQRALALTARAAQVMCALTAEHAS